MGDEPGRYGYASGGAELYDALGIEGTTYEIGFEAVRRALGDIRDQDHEVVGILWGPTTRRTVASHRTTTPARPSL